MTSALEELLRAILGDGAGVGSAVVGGTDGLWPEETAAIAKAVPKRRAEFAAGRRAARSALSRIGIARTALPVGAGRAPLWPKAVVGAITHDAGVALAAVMLSAEAQGLGIDLTEAAPLPEETRRSILHHAAEQGLSPLEERAVFSAKECLFKALFPLTGTYFGFDAAVVKPDLEGEFFGIRLTRALGSFAAEAEWTGRVVNCEGCLLTTFCVP